MKPIIIVLAVVIGSLLTYGILTKFVLKKSEASLEDTETVGDTTGMGVYADPYYMETDPNLTELGKERIKMIRNCLKKAGLKTKTYPELTRQLCECMADTIFAHFSVEELYQTYQLPVDEQADAFRPVVLKCQTTHADAIEAILIKKSEPNVDPSIF